MRTTIDLPDETYKSLKRIALEEDSTVRQLFIEGVEDLIRKRTARSPRKRRLSLPLIPSSGRTIDLDNERIYDIIGFP